MYFNVFFEYWIRCTHTFVLSLLDVPQSPLSLHDRYSSPAAGSAKRRLFGDDAPPQSPVKRISVTPIKIIPNSMENNLNTTATTTVLSMATINGQQLTIPCPSTTLILFQPLIASKTFPKKMFVRFCCWCAGVPYPLVMKNEMGGITVIQLQSSEMNPLTGHVLLTASPSRTVAPLASSDTQPLATSKPRRTGSLALFFRKVRKRVLCWLTTSVLFDIWYWMKIFVSGSA